MQLHPVQRRYLAEQLVRRRRADEQERYAVSQRRGRIDANPHQVNAVIFALQRIPEGGCILADEVGLGKTIEAGLVIAQMLAEGASRILVIVPKSLLGQWQNELYALFGIEALDVGSDNPSFHGSGVYLVGREFAGGERGWSLLKEANPFDLCVIDEAHEIFAGIHKRYDKYGNYKSDDESTVARMAHRVRQILANTPILLLTATPIQNSLAELWGLIQYVEPTGTLLGSLPVFRSIFCAGDDRRLVPEQADDLRERLSRVLHRTLRRQAQEFLSRPFVDRRARLFEYEMSSDERALYDDVTEYLLDPNIYAFQGRQRQLLLIGFHRRMASSQRALASSLNNVAARLEKMKRGGVALDDDDKLMHEMARDLDESIDVDSNEDEPDAGPAAAPIDPVMLQAELDRVRSFAERAEGLPTDSKADALVRAVRLIRDRGTRGEGSGKVVIFSESIATQEYVRDLLIADGVADEAITLFRGSNNSPRVRQAVARWSEEVESQIPSYNRPSAAIATRLALVHEFRTRSQVFIATEAGAKGLNLQFCEDLINYDLPWNPQRIEQRIGRCHRYGQEHDVTVINFIARDNEAQRLTFEILSQKLDLFGAVLDASDSVLYEPQANGADALVGTIGVDFEKRLSEIYEHARTIDDVTAELKELRDEVEAERRRFEDTIARTRGLIETQLDEQIRGVFEHIKTSLPDSLARLDADLDRMLTAYLDAREIDYDRSERDGRIYYTIAPMPEDRLLSEGVTVAVGHASDLEDAEALHLGHPLVRAAIDESRAATSKPYVVRCNRPKVPQDRSAGRGRIAVTKVSYEGFEPVDRLLLSGLMVDGHVLNQLEVEAILRANLTTVPRDGDSPISDDDLQVTVDEAVFLDQLKVNIPEEARFQRAIEQVERFIDDRILVLRRQRSQLDHQYRDAVRRRDGATGPTARQDADQRVKTVQAECEQCDAEIGRLTQRRDDEYQRWHRKALERRARAPEVTRILDVEFILDDDRSSG